uniref:sensor histidine kinase n=1 Tax=Acetatifactor sp. TaxID=1872090 RepID=UPI0040566F30
MEENAIAKIEVEKNALQQNYYAHVQESLQTISYLRHDFKNHLMILQGHATAGNTEELNNYLNRICEELTPSTLLATPSPLLSAILNAKNEECKRAGVTLTLEQNFTGIYFDDFHLVTIFSNLLDNAITAASKCKHGTIRLRITTIKSYLDIDCVNNHIEHIDVKNDRFMSTKPTQKEIHGLGILSMRKTVEQLNGEMEIDYTEDCFHVNILVPNYK